MKRFLAFGVLLTCLTAFGDRAIKIDKVWINNELQDISTGSIDYHFGNTPIDIVIEVSGYLAWAADIDNNCGLDPLLAKPIDGSTARRRWETYSCFKNGQLIRVYEASTDTSDSLILNLSSRK